MMGPTAMTVAAAAAGRQLGGAPAQHTAAAIMWSTQRFLSVLSWGRNTEWQCGIEGAATAILQPTAVLELLQQPVTALAAGHQTSAAILSGTEVFTFGEGGDGKLGLGHGHSVAAPSRVEAFVGRTAIAAVALGAHHSLFLDATGGMWAAGANSEGQLGCGTPLEVVAAQRRRAWHQQHAHLGGSMASQSSAARLMQQMQAAAAADAAAEADGGHTAAGWGSLGGWARGSDWAYAAEGGSSSSRSRRSWLAGPAAHGRRGPDGGSSGSGWQPPRSAHGSISSTGTWNARDDLSAHLAALHMEPGQVHTPLRVGFAHSPGTLLSSRNGTAAAADDDDAASAAGAAAAAAAAAMGQHGSGSLAGEQVVAVAAGRHLSLAVTARGEVFACGSCYSGGLGSEEASWQSTPTRVSAAISDALAVRGGATAVAAGTSFAAALTASGAVLVWGRLFTHAHGASSTGGGSSSSGSSSGSSSQAPPAGSWCEVKLPLGTRVRHIAAGQQHLLLSDGARVWCVGRWLGPDGQEAGAAECDAPAELLAQSQVGSAGITQLAAGMHSSGAVDGDGRLWLWGRLLHEAQGRAITRGVAHVGATRSADAGAAMAAAAAAEQRMQRVDWGWAGFGGAAPRVVPGLSGVRQVALGGWHALALVD